MKVLLSVGREGEGAWRDLELPANQPLQDLLPHLGAILGSACMEWEVLSAPPARPVDPSRTLAEAGVWSGAWLLLRPRPGSNRA